MKWLNFELLSVSFIVYLFCIILLPSKNDIMYAAFSGILQIFRSAFFCSSNLIFPSAIHTVLFHGWEYLVCFVGHRKLDGQQHWMRGMRFNKGSFGLVLGLKIWPVCCKWHGHFFYLNPWLPINMKLGIYLQWLPLRQHINFGGLSPIAGAVRRK